jgi:hypothetical protein
MHSSLFIIPCLVAMFLLLTQETRLNLKVGVEHSYFCRLCGYVASHSFHC